MSKKRTLLLLVLLAFVGYQALRFFGEWSADQLEVNHYALPQEVLPGAGPLRIALVSDVHDDREQLELCLEALEQEKPDLIIFGGDLVRSMHRLGRTRGLVEQLRRLRAIAPTYAIWGNQDYEMPGQVVRLFATAGIPLLRNEALTWQTPSGAPLRLVGLGDWNEGDEAPAGCMSLRGQADTPVLLLSHDPESRHLLQAYDWNLMLSGHTHGGQLGIPFARRWICFRSDMPGGHYVENGRHHVVSRGVGSIEDMRFFCPPEVVVVEVGGNAAAR